MNHTFKNKVKSSPILLRLAALSVLSLGAVLANGCGSSSGAGPAKAGSTGGRTGTITPVKAPELFATPEEGLQGLKSAFAAASKTDDPAAVQRILQIFGPEAKELLDTGDPVADHFAIQRFSTKLEQRAELVSVQASSYGTRDESLYLLRFGNFAQDLRIPLRQNPQGQGWYFDTEHAKESVQELRMALNEIRVSELLLAYVRAQRLYIATDWNHDGVKEYAQAWISQPGKHDGLYWPDSDSAGESPLTEQADKAIKEGYTLKAGGGGVFHGYRFKFLEGQGPAARGGKQSYKINGKLQRGFAVLAYPDIWGVSGKYSLMISNTGLVYRRDLGSQTTKKAKATTLYDPTSLWLLVEHPPLDKFNPTRSTPPPVSGYISIE